MRKFVVIISCWSCALSATSAQEDSLRTQYLDEVVVSASRSDQLIKDIPRSISVINQDQIESSIYNSVGELLSQQEGVYLVGSNQTPGTNQALFLRGANSNQVLVMIDGIRVSDPSSPNNAIDLSELSLTQVDHIEIIKGSHSTLYGSSAIGGVVNIITKKGGREGLHGAVSVLGGALGNNGSNFTQQADIQYKLSNGLYLAGSVFNQNVKGLNAALDTISNRFKPADKDDFEKTDGSIKVGFKNSSLDLFASYKSTFQQADIDAGAYGDDDNNYLNFYRNFWSYGGVYKINSKWNVKAIGSVSNLRRINENDSSLVSLTMYDNNYFKGTYYGDLFTHEGQVNYSGDKINAMLGGGSYTEQMHFDTYFYSSAFGGFESVTNYDSISTKTSTRYAFAQIKISTGDDSPFNITFGGRLSNHSLFGSYLTYEANPSLNINSNTLLYGSFSTGFNAPSLYQLYDPTIGGTFITRGNRDLEPEESRSIELGVKRGLARTGYVTLSLFSTQTNNAIEYVYLWNKNTQIANLSFLDYEGDTYINLSQQTINGIEVAGYYEFGKFGLTGNLTWLNGTITSNPNDLPSDQIDGNHVQLFSNGAFINSENAQEHFARRPQLTAFSKLQFNFNENVSFNLNYRLAGSRFDSFYDPTLGPFGAQGSLEIDSYHLFDLGARVRISKILSATVSVENVFNTNYQEINGFLTRGRSAYLKLIAKW